MTRKIAGLTGTYSAFSVGLILVFALLVSPWSDLFPDLRFSSTKTENESTFEANQEQITDRTDEYANPVLKLIPSQLESDPEKISGLNKASGARSVFGVKEKPVEEAKNSTLTSLVLAEHLPERELGTFEITYQITPEEYEMLLYCVDFETRSGCFEHKALITQVVMNRVQGKRFPFTVSEVLFAPNQFDVMPKFELRGDWIPSEMTYRAVDAVLSGNCPDYAQGALYFCNPYLVGEDNWFDTKLTTICEIEGHRFYK